MAVEFAREAMSIAADLYGGKVGTTREERWRCAAGGAAVRPIRSSWIDWLRANQAVNGKVATVGWCFGGGWAINAAIAAPVEATVIYYGKLPQSAKDVQPVQGPVLGHFGEQDKFINHEMVAGFEKAMKEAGKPLTVHWYDANHALNPTSERYTGRMRSS
jgi:carboxymethylenebutenolidase